jgi:hypothetical protein
VNEQASAGDNAEEAKARVTAEKIEERYEKNQFRHFCQTTPKSFSGLFYLVLCLFREEVGEQLKIDGLVVVLL